MTSNAIVMTLNAVMHEPDGLKHVKQVTFVKGRDAIGEFAQIPFDMVWSVTLLDGRNLAIDVNARPAKDGASPMVGWGIHLH